MPGIIETADETLSAGESSSSYSDRHPRVMRYTRHAINTLIKIIALYPPISVGVSDGAETLMGMERDGYRSIFLLITASLLSGGITTGITAPTTMETAEELITLIKQASFPENWTQLPSRIKEEINECVRKVFNDVGIELNADDEINEQLLNQLYGKANASLPTLLGRLLRLRDHWQGGAANEESYALIEGTHLDPNDSGAVRAYFYEEINKEIALLKEDYPSLASVQNVFEEISHWEAWPRQKKLLAFMMMSPVVLIASSLDAVGTFFFIKSIPEEYAWAKVLPSQFYRAFAAVCATGALLTSVTTEGKESFMGVAQLFNKRDSVQYSSHMSSIVSPLLGYSLSLVNAFLEVCGDYMMAKEVFSLVSKTHLGLVGAAALLSAIPNIYFIGGYTTEVFDDLMNYVKQTINNRKELNYSGLVKDLVSASIALGLSAYLSQLGRLNNKAAMTTIGTDLGINNKAYDHVTNIFVWVLFVHYSITGVPSLYQPIRAVVGGTVNKAKQLTNCVSSLFSAKPAEADIEASRGLLSDQENMDDELPANRKFGCRGACTIL